MHNPAEPTSAWLTVPNAISLARIGLTPVLFALIVWGPRWAAVTLLAVMAFSDYLDGRIARATGTVSRLGVALDPVGDRVMVMATLAALMVDGSMHWWLGAPVIVRDAAISIAFVALSRYDIGRPPVRRVGKVATALILTSLPLVLLGGPVRIGGLVVFAAGAVLYYVAGVRYVKDVKARFEAERRT